MSQFSISISCLLLMFSLASISALDIGKPPLFIVHQEKPSSKNQSHWETELSELSLKPCYIHVSVQEMDLLHLSIATSDLDEANSLTDLAQMNLSAGKISVLRPPLHKLPNILMAIRLEADRDILTEVSGIFFDGQDWVFDMISREPGDGGIYRVTPDGTVSYENNH